MNKKASQKSTFRKIIGWLHLWLGMLSGLIVFFVAATGTAFVYCDEIIDAIAGEARYVQGAQTQIALQPEELIAKFGQQMPEARPFYFDTYRNTERSFRIASELPNENGDEGTLVYSYLNPYTGQILKTSSSYNFFFTIAHLHAEILLHDTGKTIVGIATIIFFIQLIGGLVLWWPKKWTKNTRTSSFKIKSGTKWRRKNYDLHNVLGFYTLLPAIIITITGLIMSYEILGKATHKAFGSNSEGRKLMKNYAPPYSPEKSVVPYQRIINEQFSKDKKVEQVRLSILDSDSVTTYYTAIGSFVGLRSNIDGRNFQTDKYTGKEIIVPSDIKNYDRVYSTYFNLHVGYWLGGIGKFITFIVGLICTSLPITGFLIWYGRKYKSKNKNHQVKKIHNHRKSII